jgi:regulator of sirC expression with transglutaminase-like and TPR domain
MRDAREQLGTGDGLLAGAVAIARHHDADATLDECRAMLDAMATEIRSRVRGNQPQALLAHLHEYLFTELGMVGNSLNYHDAKNSYLPSVLEGRRGLPITLSLVYKLVADRIGLTVHGIGLPGHFCAGVTTDVDAPPMIVDCFAGGRVLTTAEAEQRAIDTYGPQFEWSDALLRPVTHRHWLTRMMQNLLHTFGERDQMTDVGAMLEMELLLWPEQAHLQRDLALVLARVGHTLPAQRWLSHYLDTNPHDPQRDDLEQLLSVLSPDGRVRRARAA